MVSLGHVTLFLVSKWSDWIHATNLGLTPHVHPLKGFDEGTVQSLKSRDLLRTNSKGYRMSGKVYQIHLKCFFFSLLLFLPPKLQKYANFWEKCRFPVFFCRFALKQSQVCFFFLQIWNSQFLLAPKPYLTQFHEKNFFSRFLFKGIWWRYSTIT